MTVYLCFYLRHFVPSAQYFWQEGPFMGELDSISIYYYHRHGSCCTLSSYARAESAPGRYGCLCFFYFAFVLFGTLASLLGSRSPTKSEVNRQVFGAEKILCSGPVTRLVGRNRVPNPGYAATRVSAPKSATCRRCP